MSMEVDNRIVQMTFDNDQFEKGIKETTKSLQAFKEELEFEDSSGALKSIANGIQGLQNSFTAVQGSVTSLANHMTTVLGRAILRLKDQMANMFIGSIRSLSVDQISAGFGKYGAMTEYVNTISSATKLGTDTIYDALAELNHYTDITSYNLTDMVNTVSKFVSNGRGLEESIITMKGIGNAAALAGVSVEKTTTATYNFAQAMAAGSMKYSDWKSLEMINFTTKDFKERSLEAAVAVGTLTKKAKKLKDGTEQIQYFTTKGKKMEVTAANLGSTLSKGWYTTDVMMKVLTNFADDETALKAASQARTFAEAMDAIRDAVSTSWLTSFQTIFGGLDDAVDMWTKFCDAIIEVTDAIGTFRNDVLSKWDQHGGRKLMLDAVANTWKIFLSIVEPVVEAVKSVIDPFEKAATVFDKFDTGLNFVDDALNGLGITVSEFREIGIDGVIEKYKLAGTNIGHMLEILKEADGKDTGIGWIETLKEEAYESNSFAKMIASGLTDFTKSVADFTAGIISWLEAPIENGMTRVQMIANAVSGVIAMLSMQFKTGLAIWNGIKKIFDAFKPSIDQILGVFYDIGIGLKDTDKYFEETSPIIKIINMLADAIAWFASKLTPVAQLIRKFDGSLLAVIPEIRKWLGGLLDSFREWITNKTNIKAAFSTIGDGFVKFANKVLNFSKLMLGNFKQLFKNGISKESLKTFWINTKGFFNGTFPKVHEFAEKARTFVKDVRKTISDFFGEEKDGESKKTFKGLWAGLKSTFKSSFPNLYEWLAGVKAKIISIWNTIVSWFRGVFGGKEAVENSEVLDEETKQSFAQNIWNSIVGAFNTVKNYFTGEEFKNFISGIWESVKSWFTKWFGKNEDGTILAWEKVKEIASKLWTSIKGIFVPVVEYVKSEEFKNKVKEIWEAIKKAFTNAFNAVKGWFKPITDFFAKLPEAFEEFKSDKDLKQKFIDFWGKIKDFFEEAFPRISEWWSGVYEKVKAVWESVVKWISDVFGKKDDTSSRNGPAKTLEKKEGLINGIVQFIQNIGKSLSGIDLYGALAIVGIVAVITTVVKAVLNITYAMAALSRSKLLSAKASGMSTFKSFGEKFRAFAEGIALMAASVAVISILVKNFGMGTMHQAVLIITEMVGLVLVFEFLNKILGLQGGKNSKASAAISAIGKSLLMMSAAVAIITLIPPKKIEYALTVITELLGLVLSYQFISSLIGLIPTFGKGSTSIKSMGEGILALAASMLIIAILPEKSISKAAKTITVLLVELALISRLSSKKDMGKMNGLLAMAGAIAILGVAMRIIAGLKPEDAWRAVEIIGALAAICVGFIDLTKLGGTSSHPFKSAFAILLELAGVAAIMIIFTRSLTKIKDVSEKKILSFAGGISALMLSMAVSARICNKVNIGGILKIAAIIALVVGVVFLLTELLAGISASTGSSFQADLENVVLLLTTIGEAVGGLVGGLLGEFTATLGEGLGKFGENIQPLIDTCSGVPDNCITGALQLSGLIALLTANAFLHGISLLLTGGLGSFAAMALDLAALGVGLNDFYTVVKDIDPEKMLTISKTMVNLEQVFTNLMKARSAITNMDAVDPIRQFCEKLPALGSAMVDFKNSIEDIKYADAIKVSVVATALKNLQDVYTSITGYSFNDEIRAALAGDTFATDYVDPIDKFTAAISKLGSSIGGFIAALDPKYFDSDTVVETASKASDILKKLQEVATSFGTHGGVVNWFKGETDVADFQTFVDALATLGPNLESYVGTTKGIKSEDVANATNATGVLTAVINAANTLHRQGGWAGKVLGEVTPIGEFAEELEKVAPKLAGYISSMSQIGVSNDGGWAYDEGKVRFVTDILGSLAAIAKDLPRENGWLQAVIGHIEPLGEFAEDIVSITPRISGYVASISSIGAAEGAVYNYGKVKQVTDILNSLVEIANAMPKEHGWFQVIGGTAGDLGAFAESMSKISGNLTKFFSDIGAVEEIDDSSEAKVTKVLGLCEELIKLAGDLANVKGAISKLGDFDVALGTITSLIGNMSIIASNSDITYDKEKILAYITSLKGTLNAIATNLEKGAYLGNAAGNRHAFDGDVLDGFDKSQKKIEQASSAVEMLVSAANDLELLSSEDYSFSEEVVISRITAIKNCVNDIAGIASEMNTVRDMSMITTNVQAMIPVADALAQIEGDTFLNKFSSVIAAQNNQDQWGGIGSTLIGYLVDGFYIDEVRLTKFLSDLKTTMIESGEMKDFRRVGYYMVRGMMEGLNNNGWRLKVAALSICRIVDEAVRKFFGVESPSREFEEIGMYLDMGLANGLKQYSKVATDSAEEMSSDVLKSVKDPFSTLSSALTSDLDVAPTIRPVLDLSDIQAKSGLIGGMLGGSRSIGVSAYSAESMARNIGGSYSNRSKDGISSAILDRLNLIGEHVEALETNFAGMNVILDSGAMVGQLGPRLDKMIGRYTVQKGRGN